MYRDKQIGDSCFIDNNNTYLCWRADLIDAPVVTPGETTAGYGDFAGRIVKYNTETAACQVAFAFYVYGETPDECECNTSGLITGAKSANVVSIEKSWVEYAGTFIGAASEQAFLDWKDNNYYNKVTLTFAAVQRGKLQTLPIPAPGQWIAVKGTSAAPCRITLRPNKNMATLTILGVTVSNLKAGETFVIDGIDGKFTDFTRINLIDFPTLKPGNMYVNPSTTISGTLEYYPIF